MRKWFPFRRKTDENAYEALERLDRKLDRAKTERHHWISRVSLYALHIVADLEDNIAFLLGERRKLEAEIEERHKSIASLGANVIRM